MMKRSDFLELARYCNENYKGSFTDREIFSNAYDYWCEYEWSKRTHKYSFVIQSLLELLKDDATKEALEWVNRIEH